MLRVLIVDDESARDDISEILCDSCGMSAEATSSAESCLSMLQNSKDIGKPFDAVVLDIYLQNGRNGDEIIDDILQISPRICIVMLTAFSKVPTAIGTLRKGAFQYMMKTGFDPKEHLAPVIRAGVAHMRLRCLRQSLLDPGVSTSLIHKRCSDIIRESVSQDSKFHLAVASQEVEGWEIQYPFETEAIGRKVLLDNHPLVRSMRSGETVHARFELDAKKFAPLREDTRSLVAVPIREARGSFKGFVDIESSKEAVFDQYTIEVMSALAEVVAMLHAIKDRDEAIEDHELAKIGTRIAEAKASSFEFAAKECAHYIRNAVHVLRPHCYSLLQSVESVQSPQKDLPDVASLVSDVKSFLSMESKFDDIEDVLTQMGAIGEPIEPLFEETSVGNCIESRLENYRLLATQLDVRLELVATDELLLLKMRADKKMIGTALDMVIENAIESTANRSDSSISPQVRFSVAAMKNQIRFLVQDNGDGIRSEDFPRLFQPQFSTKQPSPLRGYGLFTAQRIILKHGGSIVGRNRLGQNDTVIGAEFEITLPLRNISTEASESDEQS